MIRIVDLLNIQICFYEKQLVTQCIQIVYNIMKIL